uniref:WD repeat domain phosphoinositide-interacting protein 3 n=1 Tax=Auxenochlorella protothecoides TaxID=3075 RepID=A0A1D2A4A7_AUXPR
MAKSPEKKKFAHELLHLSFNQDQGCFAVGTSNGFRVHNCEPFKETFRREFSNGGIGIVEMLFRSNILALVGGGPLPRYPPNKVMLWDDHQGRCIGELSFRSRVRRVALRRDLLAVALEHKVLVYAFSDLRLTASVETAANAAGLLALSTGPDAALLACPGLHSGQVRLEAYATRRTRFVQAHSGALGALCLTPSGKHLATASERGTLLRVWSTADGTRLQELRRGTDAARIHSLAFSGGRGALAATPPEWLAVTSDRGTAHVFSLRRGQGVGPAGDRADGGGGAQQQQQPEGRANPTSKLAFVSVSRGLGEVTQSLGLGSWWDLRTQMPWAAFLWLLMPAQGSTMYVLPCASLPTGCNPHPCPPLRHQSYLPLAAGYFSSERSFAQFHLPDGAPTVVGFGQEPGTLLLLSSSGLFYNLAFDPLVGGACEQVSCVQFMEEAPRQGGGY